MDPVTIFLVPALAGGVVVAALLAIAHKRSRGLDQPGPRRNDGMLVDAINMAHIRVAGVGGLGLMAMAVLVAVFLPTIRVSLIVAAAAGVLLAVGLILWRRRSGPLPSSGPPNHL
jgi:hypothetical protein